MNYTNHYIKLIERAKNRLLECYTERHHIVPKCMGGSNENSNLVRLTAREHYVAHQLLVKMNPGKGKLVYALRAMTDLDVWGHRSKNKQYSWTKTKLAEEASKRRKGKSYNEIFSSPEIAGKMRKNASERMKGNTNTLGMSPWNKGRTWSEETKKKMSAAKMGIKRPDVATWTSKAVIIDGVKYPAMKVAAKELGVHPNTITQWIKSNKAIIT